MSTRTKVIIVTLATIIGIICAPLGVFLRAITPIYDIGISMWFGGALLFYAPISGGLFSLGLSLFMLTRTDKKRIIFSVCAIVSFLDGIYPSNMELCNLQTRILIG